MHHFTHLDKWSTYHPHADYKSKSKTLNTLYLSKDWINKNEKIKGYGTFNYNQELVLTKKGESKSKWQLPECFQGKEITYHNDSNWKKGYFQSASRGQEFVVEEDTEIKEWALSLIQNSVK